MDFVRTGTGFGAQTTPRSIWFSRPQSCVTPRAKAKALLRSHPLVPCPSPKSPLAKAFHSTGHLLGSVCYFIRLTLFGEGGEGKRGIFSQGPSSLLDQVSFWCPGFQDRCVFIQEKQSPEIRRLDFPSKTYPSPILPTCPSGDGSHHFGCRRTIKPETRKPGFQSLP